MKYLSSLFAFSFALALLAGCDDGTIPPPPDSGARMDTGVLPTDAGPPEPMCDNGMRDGDEAGVDCGGSCPACEAGSPCTGNEDCDSGVCGRGFCLVPSCSDEVRNGDETGTDCGGDCMLCPGGESCTANEECLSGRCRGGECAASSCEDMRQNSDETDIDCGGATCPPCGGGLACLTRDDCESGICAAGMCTTPACNDSRQNQDETSVDCGGAICPGCRDGLACNIDADCENMRCLDGGCISCTDRVQNGDETGVDCGGTTCDACPDGQGCLVDGDCNSNVCEASFCVSCSDGTLNQDETDVDCGGSLCDTCRNGLACATDADCASSDCDGGLCRGLADTCSDAFVLADGRNVINWTAFTNDYFVGRLPSCVSFGTVDGPDLVMTFTASLDGVVEYDIEKPSNEEMAIVVSDAACGMPSPELHCESEFSSANLTGSFPVTMGTTYTLYFVDVDTGTPTLIDPLVVNIREVDGRCRDMVANNMETDVDCGGPICPTCTTGQMCAVAGDCDSSICMGGTCNAPGCGDGTLNGRETDLDCGGGACAGCATGQTCMLGRDCASGVCSGGVCQAPTCTDGVSNGDETGVDCGGPTTCPRCPDFQLCDAPSDCTSMACTMGVCGSTGCIPFPGTSTDAYGYFGCSITLPPASLPCPDISATGTPISLTDDSSSMIPIGFNFDFYGANYTNVWVNSNGGVAFDRSWSSLSNTCTMPYTSGFSAQEFVSIMWDDLRPSGARDVLYQLVGTAPNRQLVVRYDIARYFSSPSNGVFSVVLNEGSNNIEVCYYDTDFGDVAYNGGASATSSINHGSTTPGPSTGLLYSCNAANLTDGLLLRYIHPPPGP